MNLWSLLLPFKWITIGVGVVFSGIFSLLNKTFLFIGSLFVYLFEGIITISRGIGLVIKWLILKMSFLLVLAFTGLKTVIIGFFRLLVTIINVLFKTVKTIVVYFFKALKSIILGLAKAFKFMGNNVFAGLITVLKTLFKVLKKLIISLGKAIKYLFEYIFKGFKYFFIYLYKIIYFILQYLYLFIKTILTYIWKALHFILIGIIYKYLGVLIRAIGNVLIVIIRFIMRIPSYIWKAIKYVGHILYKIFVYPFVYLYKNFGRIIVDAFNKVKGQLKKGFTSVIKAPQNIKKKVVAWFFSLSFVKDIINRRDMKRKTLLIDFDAEDAVRSEKKIDYHYVAKNPEGKVEKGVLSAYSKLDVHSFLLAEGFEVYEIAPDKRKFRFGAGGHKIKVSELVFFLAQLSTYIKSGIPLVDSIKILSKQAKKRNTKTVYKSVIYDLTMGVSFSEALEKQGQAFPKLLVNMVKSSELAGNLAETLDDMGEYYTAVSKTRKQMKSAMTYPTVILVFALAVIIFILTFVIPSFIEMYKDADAEVPALTTAVINLSDFLVENFVWLIIGVGAAGAGIYFLYKNVKVFRMIVQWIAMHMPVLGNIMIYNEVTMFSKTFASLWNHNVFITSSMEILSKITDNEIYKMLIFDAITNVARGEPVSASFKNHWAFPLVAYEMLVTGERTGQPGPMMAKVAEYYAEEHVNAVNQIKAFIEPAMIIILAVGVGIILLSVILPMFSIYGQIGLEAV